MYTRDLIPQSSMQRLIRAALVPSILVLAACKPFALQQTPPPVDPAPVMQEEPMMKDGQPAVAGTEKAMMEKGVYTAYHDGVIGNGETSVLFFHAAWCPICKREDAALMERFAAGGDGLFTVYKVDYDSSPELRQRYGITYQHTFVRIDGQGNAVETIQAPSAAQLTQLIQK